LVLNVAARKRMQAAPPKMISGIIKENTLTRAELIAG
jgi:hypothetical protein